MVKRNKGHIVREGVCIRYMNMLDIFLTGERGFRRGNGRNGPYEYVVFFSNISCNVGINLYPADYCASKAALISLHESLRYELDHQYRAPGVRTTLVVAGHVLTKMFSTVRLSQNWFYRFFVPSLPPVDLAKAVIAALDEQHSRTIYMPFYTNFVPFLPLLPSFLRDFAQWVSLDVPLMVFSC